MPTSNNCICLHFGHCDKFALYITENKKITEQKFLSPPTHEPGILPAWLAKQGATHIIAGGMGHRAISLFNQQKIHVITGAEEKTARLLVEDFLGKKLKTGLNGCDH